MFTARLSMQLVQLVYLMKLMQLMQVVRPMQLVRHATVCTPGNATFP